MLKFIFLHAFLKMLSAYFNPNMDVMNDGDDFCMFYIFLCIAIY